MSYKTELIKNQNNYDPVTKEDLEVNEIIIKKLNEKYTNVNWGILSEENAKMAPKIIPRSITFH